MWDIDLRPFVWLAVVGAIAVALAVLVGVPLLSWWFWSHLQWVG